MQTFCIHLSDLSVSAKSASISEEAPDITNVPNEYHDFANIFSKARVEKLALHQQNRKVNTLPCNDYNFHLDYHLGETLFQTR